MNETVVDWMALSQIPGIGIAGFWNLVDRCGSPSAVLGRSGKQLESLPGVNGRQLRGLAEKDGVRDRCRQQLEALSAMGGDCLLFDDARYPQLLREISDPPPLLYAAGRTELLAECCIAVVGSRAMTTYGSRTARQLSRRLAEENVVVVSGMALGIDTQAHQGALQAEGKTVGVLGCGIDVVYPRQNRELFDRIRRQGVIVSEYPLGTPPEGFRFPARNRIIAGLSRGVVVVEAARKSGSLITAQLAIDEGREVYAVPGQVDSYKSEGTHWLLRQGAKLVQSADDILEDIVIFQGDRTGGSQEEKSVPSGLDARAANLLTCLEAYPVQRDVLLARSGLPVFEFSELLLLLELEGLVEILPGDEIRRLY